MSLLSDKLGGGGGIGIDPCLASSTEQWVSGTSGLNYYARYLPMTVTDNGEFLDVLSTTLKHYTNKNALNWTFTVTSAVGANFKISGIYWDKVDNRLYVLCSDSTANNMQMGWVNTASGAYTAVGAAFAMTAAIVTSLNTLMQSTFRRTAQGSGDFDVTTVTGTGMATFVVPAAGGSYNTLDPSVTLNGCDPVALAPFKVATGTYIGALACPANSGSYTGIAADRMSMNYATLKGQKRYGNFHNGDGSVIGISGTNGTPVSQTNIQDWGGDICIQYVSFTSESRNGPILLDAIDFERWALEQLVAVGAY